MKNKLPIQEVRRAIKILLSHKIKPYRGKYTAIIHPKLVSTVKEYLKMANSMGKRGKSVKKGGKK